jgi:hypothetical protein
MMRKFFSVFLRFLTKPIFNLSSQKPEEMKDEIQNARSEVGADIQWFFDTLDASLTKTGDDKWELRYNKFLVLSGNSIQSAKKNYENRRKFNGAIICENMSDLQDKENRRIILENTNRMKVFSKTFYDKMDEILNDWFTTVLLLEPPEERLYQSTLKDRELTEMQFLNDNAKYYGFILENGESFIFTNDGAEPIKEHLVDEYSELVTKMTESLNKYIKNRIFDF